MPLGGSSWRSILRLLRLHTVMKTAHIYFLLLLSHVGTLSFEAALTNNTAEAANPRPPYPNVTVELSQSDRKLLAELAKQTKDPRKGWPESALPFTIALFGALCGGLIGL